MKIIAKALSTIRLVELVRKKVFATLVLDPDNEIFIVFITSFVGWNIDIKVYLFYKVWIAFLKAKKTFISILFKYANFEKIFSKNLVAKLLKHIEINNHTIILIKSYDLSYKPIHSLKLVKLEIFKTYIKTNLPNCFIKLLLSLINIIL